MDIEKETKKIASICTASVPTRSEPMGLFIHMVKRTDGTIYKEVTEVAKMMRASELLQGRKSWREILIGFGEYMKGKDLLGAFLVMEGEAMKLEPKKLSKEQIEKIKGGQIDDTIRDLATKTNTLIISGMNDTDKYSVVYEIEIGLNKDITEVKRKIREVPMVEILMKDEKVVYFIHEGKEQKVKQNVKDLQHAKLLEDFWANYKINKK